ncbi:MAG TPA: hypothetical protein VL574_03345, partial [Stellaceae bacterium]|nr:hypothetical protein [Stellaceae bacterium]
GAYIGRFMIVVDDDVDPSDIQEVLWAMCTRCDPVEDIDFVRKAWSGPLDPRLPKGVTTGSRAVIDACRPWERINTFPKVARGSPELLKKIEEKFADILKQV